jgi:hypothetical protein
MPVGRRTWAVVLGAVLLPIAGCSSDLAEFLERGEIWRTQGPDDYTWTLEVSEPVFGRKSAEITVRDGRAIDVRGDLGNTSPTTVDELIDHLIRSADADSIRVRWADLGYPSRVRIDHSGTTIDDEVTYRVLSFRVE